MVKIKKDQPILFRGGTCEQVIVDESLINYCNNQSREENWCNCLICMNCKKVKYSSEKVFLIRNYKRRIVCVFCSVSCQRQYALEVIAKKQIEWRQKRQEKLISNMITKENKDGDLVMLISILLDISI